MHLGRSTFLFFFLMIGRSTFSKTVGTGKEKKASKQKNTNIHELLHGYVTIVLMMSAICGSEGI